MVARPRQPVVAITPEDVAEIQAEMEHQIDQEETPNDIAYENLRAELGIEGELVDARVYVSKLNYDDEGNEARVWEGAPGDLKLTRLAKKFGSGQYRIKLYSKGEKGYRVHRGTKTEGILLPPEESAPVATMQAPAALSIDDVRRTVVETMAMLQPKPQPAPDPMQMMMQLSEVMRNLMPAPQSAPQVDQFGMLKEAIGLVKSLQGDMEPIERGVNASTSDVLLGMLNKFGGPIANALQAGQYPTPAPHVQSAPPMPSVQSVPAQSIPTPSPSADDTTMKLKMALNLVITACEAGGSPETYADLALDHVPEAEITQLLALPDPVAALAQFDARVEKHRDWFTKMFDEIKEMLKPDTEE